MVKRILNILSNIFLIFGILGIIVGLLNLSIGLLLFYLVWTLLGVLFSHLTQTKPDKQNNVSATTSKGDSADIDHHIESIKTPKSEIVNDSIESENDISEEPKKIHSQFKESIDCTSSKINEIDNVPDDNFNNLDLQSSNNIDENTNKNQIADNESSESTPDDSTKQETLHYEHSKYKWYIYHNYMNPETGERWSSKYTYNEVAVERVNPSFSEIFQYDTVDIVQETIDNHIIAVKFFDNILGYLKNKKIEDMANDFLSRGEEVHAQIEKITEDTIYLRMFFCKRRSDIFKPVKPFTVKLVGNKNEEMQDNIDCCYEGEEIYAERDGDRYLVWAGAFEIGYIPKSKLEYLENLDDKGYEFIGEIVEISDGVKVKIQPQ